MEASYVMMIGTIDLLVNFSDACRQEFKMGLSI